MFVFASLSGGALDSQINISEETHENKQWKQIGDFFMAATLVPADDKHSLCLETHKKQFSTIIKTVLVQTRKSEISA